MQKQKQEYAKTVKTTYQAAIAKDEFTNAKAKARIC
jgi:hypothetical protein